MTRSLVRTAVVTAAAYLPLAASALAQGIPTTRLTTPTARFPEPMSNVGGLRELSDGRVLVSDRLEKAVRILDFTNGTMQEIGHVGSGPGEYQMPGALLPLPGDSTLLVDFGNTRLTVIGPDGALHRSTAMMHPTGRFINPTATDPRGGIYFEDMVMMRTAASAGPPDSLAITRWDMGSEAFDTVGFVPSPETRMTSSGGAGGAQIRVGRPNPLTAQHAWGVAPDGGVAIARPEPYHVEWRRAEGRPVRGPDVAYRPVPVTERDKEEVTSRSAVGMMVTSGSASGGGGSRTVTIPPPNADELEWPKVKPAFQPRGVSVTPDGTLWVRRFVAFGEPETYDVFDRTGRRTRQVILPEGRTLLGFGNGVVYVSRTDEDDLRWIEKYNR
jgi:hypothetical protein